MKISVLLVDDERDFVESLAQRLQLRDFKVTIASVILLIILGLVITILWPIMGMPITLGN